MPDRQKLVLGVLGAVVAILGLYFAYLGVTSHPNYVSCRGDLEACGTRAARAEGTLENITPTIIIRDATAIVHTVTVEIEKEVTRVVTPTSSATPKVYDLCAESSPPCIHIAAASEDWFAIAKKYLGDFCRWPELANLNRTAIGTYSGVKKDRAYFITQLPSSYAPSSITPLGSQTPIPTCAIDGDTGKLLNALPCVYEIPSDKPVYGYDYGQVSSRFYGPDAYGQYIANNNLESGCSVYGYRDQEPQSIALKPGIRIIVPGRP